MKDVFATLQLAVPTTIEGLLDTIDSMLEACFGVDETIARIWPDDEITQRDARILARRYYKARSAGSKGMMQYYAGRYTELIEEGPQWDFWGEGVELHN